MLSYISHKFSEEIRPKKHEPRAALFLNRFSRTSTIMYATNGLANVLGITADQLNGKSFYYCIQENCLEDAVKCLESAKANDSIAYLRFWFRDPREADRTDGDQHMDGNSSGDDDDGGVHLDDRMDEDGSENAVTSDSSVSQISSAFDQNSTDRSSVEQDPQRLVANHSLLDNNSRSSSGNSTDLQDGAHDAIFDQPATRQSSSSSSLSFSTPNDTNRVPAIRLSSRPRQIELEAVISCTSDGLVVVLRRARALVPQITGAVPQRSYANGCFASPWATDPIMPNIDLRQNAHPSRYQPALVPLAPTGAQADTASMQGPDQEDFMNSIREVAVFAWSLTGINGSLARYGRGRPTGQSLPPGGLPIWKPDLKSSAEIERHPHHGNNPQETRQHQAASEMHTSSHTFDASNIHTDHSDYIKNSQDTTSKGQGYGYDLKSTPPSEWTNEKGNGFQEHMHNNYSNSSHNRSSHPYGFGSQSFIPSNTQTQYNDWYQQGLDSGYSDDYQHFSINGQNRASHRTSDDKIPISSHESRSEPSYRGFRGSTPQNRAHYHDNNAMDSTNTQSYLDDRPSNVGYTNGNGAHHRGHHNWLSQQH